jgi:starch synthase
MNSTSPFNVLYLSAEMVPYARTGGLALVAADLPRALRRLGDDVRVILPRYGLIDPDQHHLVRILEDFPVPFENEMETAGLWQAQDAEVPTYFIEHSRFFGERQGIYSFPDDAERFIFYSRASLEACRRLGWQPQVIHCNEWHTALVPNWIRTVYAEDPFFAETAVIYNIHNLAYQGIFGHRVLEIAGIASHGFIAHPEVSPGLNDVVSLMARGIIFADIIVTVSPTYAREILTPEFGGGLEPVLRDRQNRLFGILNGIDFERYNPTADPNLSACFQPGDPAGRAACKAALQREAHLAARPRVPLISVSSRLSDQKGYDILAAVLEPLLQHVKARWVIMGTGEQRYHDLLSDLQRRYPDRLAVFLTWDERLSRRIFAGADLFLMPSRHEPCGLDQMIAMHYGAVPVVHATGGLADTVIDHRPPRVGTGFTFKAYDGMALYAAVVRAVEAFHHPDIWTAIQRQGMSQDFSWTQPAHAYQDMYRRARSLKLTGAPA